MSKFWSDAVHKLKPYVPGEQPRDMRFVKLNTNENPYPPSPRVLDRIKRRAGENLRRYPDPEAAELREAIADFYALDRRQVFVGNGSDEILALAFYAFFQKPEPVLFADITYSFYDVYCNFFNIAYEQIPLRDDFRIAPADYQKPNGGIILANPNALTGRCLEVAQIESLLQHHNRQVVLVDEAYIDFGGRSCVALIGRYPNLLVVQTFSKSRSLAGLRVGFAMGAAALVEGLLRAKDSFNSYPLDQLALAGAVESIRDVAYFRNTCRKVIRTRQQVVETLKSLQFTVVPSKANFICIRHQTAKAADLYRQLKQRGILVRYFAAPRVENYLRVTIGTDAEMKTFIDTLTELLPGQAT
jgi:histidinol-phosphate aminotransferase